MTDHQPQSTEASLAQLKLTPAMEGRFRALLNRGEYQIPAFMLQVTLDEIDALRAERDEARSKWYFEEAASGQAEAALAEARAEHEWSEALAAWVTNVLGIVADRRVPSADVVADGEAILRGWQAAAPEPGGAG